jgi:tetratricopeptide (TPR) repeat protein
MRQLIGLLASILIVVFIGLSLADTDDYALEKHLWRINREFTIVAHDPAGASPEKFNQLIEDYERLVKRFSNSGQIPRIYLQMGRTYMLRRQWNEARDNFNIILEKYPHSDQFDGEALFYIGKTYEEENDPLSALKVYRQILKDYPLTNIGLETPLYIANYFQRMNKPEHAQKAVSEAIDLYQRIIEQSDRSSNRLRVLRKLATAYVWKEQWQEALQVLEKVLLELPSYPDVDPDAVNGVIKSINSIAVMQLNDYDKAIGIYRGFIRQHPKSELTPHIQEIANALEQLKKPSGST